MTVCNAMYETHTKLLCDVEEKLFSRGILFIFLLSLCSIGPTSCTQSKEDEQGPDFRKIL